MKHWKQWISFAAVLLFVMTACLFIQSVPQFILQAQPQATSTAPLNDGSSYSIQYHKQLASASTTQIENATVRLTSGTDPSFSLPIISILQLYPILIPAVYGQAP